MTSIILSFFYFYHFLMQLKLKADGCLGKLLIQLTTEELFVIVAQSDLMNVIVV